MDRCTVDGEEVTAQAALAALSGALREFFFCPPDARSDSP
jgi:hypothetical protein